MDGVVARSAVLEYVGAHLVPHRVVDRCGQAHARALQRRQRPIDDVVELGLALGIGKEHAALLAREMHAAQAQVVVASDRCGHGEFEGQHPLEEGHVLQFELLLQRDRPG